MQFPSHIYSFIMSSYYISQAPHCST